MIPLIGGLWGRVKTVLITVLIAALPLLYVFGRRDGGKDQEIEYLKDARETDQEIADFYRRVAEDNPTPIRSRDDLIGRLRDNGF